MPKNKKLTYKEIANYIVMIEQRFTTALNTMGQTITDYIKFNNQEVEFMDFLKNKYKKEPSDDMRTMQEGNKEGKEKVS